MIRRKYLFGGLLLTLAVAGLLYLGFGRFGIPYYTVAQLEAQGDAIYGKSVRLDGKVVPGSLARDVTQLTSRFMIEDEEGGVLRVAYRGVKTFEEGDPLSVVGRYTEEGVLQASDILTKCPSKYEAEQPSMPDE